MIVVCSQGMTFVVDLVSNDGDPQQEINSALVNDIVMHGCPLPSLGEPCFYCLPLRNPRPRRTFHVNIFQPDGLNETPTCLPRPHLLQTSLRLSIFFGSRQLPDISPFVPRETPPAPKAGPVHLRTFPFSLPDPGGVVFAGGKCVGESYSPDSMACATHVVVRHMQQASARAARAAGLELVSEYWVRARCRFQHPPEVKDEVRPS